MVCCSLLPVLIRWRGMFFSLVRTDTLIDVVEYKKRMEEDGS